MKTKAVVYARVSSVNDRQDTTRQIEDLKRYALLQDIEIVRIFQEHISGAKRLRKGRFLQNVWNTVRKRVLTICCYQNFRDWEEARYRCFALWIYCMRQRYPFIYRT